MVSECYGSKFVLNGEINTCDRFDIALVYEGDSVYEVIRMIGGHPVFFNDHMERLESSLKIQQKKSLANRDILKKHIIDLIKTETRKDINLKIVFNYNSNSTSYLVYFTEPIYPTSEQYNKGVKGILFNAERKEPESKVINHRLRTSIYHKLILEGAYEALLVNEDNCVTEGSRSNIFFLKGDELTTAPGNKILSGITRKHILEICRTRNITVNLDCVAADKIQEYDAVFMTGTSPMVLPFCCVGNIYFSVAVPVILELRQSYYEMALKSTERFIEDL